MACNKFCCPNRRSIVIIDGEQIYSPLTSGALELPLYGFSHSARLDVAALWRLFFVYASYVLALHGQRVNKRVRRLCVNGDGQGVISARANGRRGLSMTGSSNCTIASDVWRGLIAGRPSAAVSSARPSTDRPVRAPPAPSHRPASPPPPLTFSRRIGRWSSLCPTTPSSIEPVSLAPNLPSSTSLSPL